MNEVRQTTNHFLEPLVYLSTVFRTRTPTMMDDEEVKLSHVLKKAVEQVSRDFQHLQDETLPKSQGAGERV